MPRYKYRCSSCEVEKTIWHEISEKISDCEDCESCNTMEKQITNFSTEISQGKTPAGTVVKKAIEEMRQEVKMEKNRLQKEEMT